MNRNNRIFFYGVTAGIAIVAIMLGAYFLDKKLMVSSPVYWITFLFQLVAMYLCVMEAKQSNGGKMKIEEALKIAFPVFVLSSVIYYIFYYIFMNYIDTGMVAIIKSTYLEQMKEFTQVQADPAKKLENQSFDANFYTTFFSFCQGCIGGFLVSGIIALITKND